MRSANRLPAMLMLAVSLAFGQGGREAKEAAPSATKPEASPEKIAAEVDAHYNHLQTLEANFDESYAGAGIERKESGKLTLKRPGRMRWDYAQPSAKLFVTDGKTAYLYLPGERQARRTPMKNVDDMRSPIRYLLGHSQLRKELSGLAFGEAPKSPGDIVLAGVPRHLADRVKQVRLEVNGARQIVRIEIEEVDGGLTVFIFKDLVENRPVADSEFHFSPPAGVEVIEQKDLEGQ